MYLEDSHRELCAKAEESAINYNSNPADRENYKRSENTQLFNLTTQICLCKKRFSLYEIVINTLADSD